MGSDKKKSAVTQFTSIARERVAKLAYIDDLEFARLENAAIHPMDNRFCPSLSGSTGQNFPYFAYLKIFKCHTDFYEPYLNIMKQIIQILVESGDKTEKVVKKLKNCYSKKKCN